MGFPRHADRTEISIHALREEGDVVLSMSTMHSHLFLSTPSARRATLPTCEDDFMEFISIHALREEGDQIDAFGFPRRYVISIHALREEGDPMYCKR